MASSAGRRIPALASVISGVRSDLDSEFRVNYAFRPESIPVISAADLLNGKADLSQLAGKTVVVGPASARMGDQYRLPGWGKAGGVYVNGAFQINPHTPFGGVGISGFGKEGGKAGIDEFLHYKTVTVGVGAMDLVDDA